MMLTPLFVSSYRIFCKRILRINESVQGVFSYRLMYKDTKIKVCCTMLGLLLLWKLGLWLHEDCVRK